MSVCDVPVISTVCTTVSEGAAILVTAPFDWLAQAMGGAAGFLFTAVWQAFDSTTLVDVTAPAYVSVYNLLFGIAIFIALLFFCLQLGTGLVHRDPGALTRAAIGLAKSILGSFVLVTLTALLLEITDQLSIGIIQATGQTMATMGDRIGVLVGGLTTINLAAPGAGAIITIFLAGLAIAAAFIVWFSLLVRKALLLIAIVFGPVALAGFSWDATKGWFPKWATFVVALIASKLVMTVIFLVAITQVSLPITPDLVSISDPIAGIVLMFMAAFAPYLAYKFLSFVGFDMYQAMSMEQESKQALNRPLPIPNKPQGVSPRQVLDSGSGKGGSGTGGGAGGPTPAAATEGGAKGTGGGAGTSGTGGGGSAGGAAGGGASSGAGGGSAGAGGGAGAAAAGPAAAVVVGAQVVQTAATAGPKLGAAIGGHADAQAGAASAQAAQPPQTPVTPAGQRQPSPAPPPSRAPSPPPQAAPPAAPNPFLGKK